MFEQNYMNFLILVPGQVHSWEKYIEISYLSWMKKDQYWDKYIEISEKLQTGQVGHGISTTLGQDI